MSESGVEAPSSSTPSSDGPVLGSNSKCLGGTSGGATGEEVEQEYELVLDTGDAISFCSEKPENGEHLFALATLCFLWEFLTLTSLSHLVNLAY